MALSHWKTVKGSIFGVVPAQSDHVPVTVPAQEVKAMTYVVPLPEYQVNRYKYQHDLKFLDSHIENKT